MSIKIKALEVFRSDDKLESEGKWADVTGDIQFRVRRMRSKPVMDAREKIYGPYERVARGKQNLPDAIELSCTIRLLSEAIVVDWRQRNPSNNEEWLPYLLDDSGDKIEFTPENAATLFRDPDTGKDLRGLVIGLSTDGEFFAPEEIEADSGNSAAS